ncbi:VWA domain-containing protein [Streptomyces sudanensis]|uniref:VWA domain-containing protein n=1 Tax=Streptomyces sudanensis TaxID=436397 RepID=UPI0020CE7F2C|nr:VWA domain-containing protein [Streptomyces sudanensis]MCQ0002132.1 VWA domain-containing protein [Streptomyces sudanensis]
MAPESTGGGASGASAGLEISQWKYLSAEARDREMHVVLTVRVDGAGGAAGGPGGAPLLAEALVVDCSSSMTWPQEKFRAARQAAAAAVRMLPAGTPFAVVQGTEGAAMAYPAAERMAVSSDEHRRRAHSALHALAAGGGTCIGAWLDLAGRLLTEQDAPIGHVLLLTDGRNQHDEEMPLDAVLDACEGRFVCDAWGIGDGWDARELLRITRRLHGSAHAVREEAELPGEYEKLTARLLAKAVPELAIEVAPVPGTTVRYLKQVFPTEVDLEPAVLPGPGGTHRYTTRAWGDETRRYHLCLSADPTGRPRHEDLQLAVVSLTAPTAGHGLRLPPPRPCVVHWTEDPALSRHTDAQVAHFQLYGQLGQAVAAAADAHRRGDREEAEHHLGRGVRLAHTVGAARPLADFERLVEVVDAAAGRVRLRPDLNPVDFQHLITASSHSTYGPGPDDDPPGGPGGASTATVPCPECAGRAPADARFCPRCGHPLRERP